MRLNPYISKSLKAVFTVCFVFLTSCNSRNVSEYPDVYSENQVAVSDEGMVVSAASLATSAGAAIMNDGGNAVDAAVATAFALSVVEPSMSGLGGRSQILIKTPEGEFYGIDGTTLVPSGFDPDVHTPGSYGYGTVAIPGTVAALCELLDRFGTMPLEDVIKPAITYAEEGFELPLEEAERIAGRRDDLLEFDGSRKHFLKEDCNPYEAGELFVQPALANTLRLISGGGADEFYHGSIARKIVKEMETQGGYVGFEDIQNYSTEDALVVHGSYRNMNLTGTYRPASGATVIHILQMMEHFNLPGLIDSPEWISVTAQALILGIADRRRDAALIVSKEWAKERAIEIQILETPVYENGNIIEVNAGMDYTTHLSAADREGWIVSINQSIGPSMGSAVASEELGFLYAATMGYLGSLPPGTRATTSMSPLIASDNNDIYVFGAAGGIRIITSIVLTISRILDQHLLLPEAMAAPRFHASGSTVHIENLHDIYWDTDMHTAMENYGWDVNFPTSRGYFGRIHGIWLNKRDGFFTGVADPRWNGEAKSPDNN